MTQEEFIELVGKMPLLRHRVQGEEYDVEKSELVAWMMRQPGFKEWVFKRMESTGRLVFDRETGLWHGVPKGARGAVRREVDPERKRYDRAGRPPKYGMERFEAVWPVAVTEAVQMGELFKRAVAIEPAMTDPTWRRLVARAVEQKKVARVDDEGKVYYYAAPQPAPVATAEDRAVENGTSVAPA